MSCTICVVHNTHIYGQFALSNVSKSFGWMRFMKIIWHHFLLLVQKISGKKLIHMHPQSVWSEKEYEIVCSRLLPAALDYVPLQMAVIKLQSLLLLHVWLPWYTLVDHFYVLLGAFIPLNSRWVLTKFGIFFQIIAVVLLLLIFLVWLQQ